MTLDQSGAHWKRMAKDAESRAAKWQRWSLIWCAVALTGWGVAVVLMVVL